MSKIYHVELKEPKDGKQHFYFGSRAAIYQELSRQEIGIALKSLTNNHKFADGDYTNKKCTIRLGYITRKKGNRGKKQINMGKKQITSERIDGPTPSGGDYSEIYYQDAAGNPIDKEKAVTAIIRECSVDGELINETFASLDS
ncbi:MAG: hypothetical protein LIP01_01310 [Tannerellaceae bacterium]|nr:hypothetical protein [Tannerellaceae bacterium]